MGRVCQVATAGKLTRGSSPNGATDSSVMYLDLWTAHSLFERGAPTRRIQWRDQASHRGRRHLPNDAARLGWSNATGRDASWDIAHEVHPVPLPGGAQHLAAGGLDALVSVGDHQLDAAQTAARELPEELGPDRFGLRGADLHAQHLTPPSLLTPTAMIAATEVLGLDPRMRPPRRTLR